MSELKKAISDKIKENRPKLSASSVKTYISILFNIHKQITQKEEGDLSFFSKDENKIMDYLNKKKPQSRKSSLSALFILTNIESYRTLMLDDCKTVNENYKLQKKSVSEKENWISIEQIKEKYDGYLAKIKKINTSTPSSLVVEYLLLAFLGAGVAGLAPRRSLDYSLLKIRNYDTKTDNYYKGGKIVFNVYKTAKVYGMQTIEVPKQLNTVIKKWIKLNTTDYMLFSSNGNPLSSSQITKMLNKIFDNRNVSTDMLRHIYLTDMYKDVPALKQLEQTNREMGHSLATSLTYVKKD